MKERIVIFAGGSLGEWALAELKDEDLIVGADSGALFLVRHGIKPDIALGDFDSVSGEEMEQIRQYSKQLIACDPIMKDLTDTEMAFNWSLKMQPREMVLLGATGSRFDHTLANVHLLRRAAQRGIACKIVDASNEITLVTDEAVLRKSRFPYVSLLPLSMEVTGITLEGFQYPLERATLTLGQSLGVSNAIVSESARIRIANGLLLVIQSKD